jgi:hypothetical protein
MHVSDDLISGTEAIRAAGKRQKQGGSAVFAAVAELRVWSGRRLQ